MLKADPHRALDANLKALADLIEPSDTIVDVGGGAGRMSLPLASRCRFVTNVDPSVSMGAAFLANAKAAGIDNVGLVQSDWIAADAPQGTVALVNHVTYLTRDIVSFIEKLERAGSRRVILTVNAPPPPSWNRVLFQLVHGEPEEVVPGHAELMNVLWEMGRLPDLTMMLPPNVRYIVPLPTRAAALGYAVERVGNEQWAHWRVADASKRASAPQWSSTSTIFTCRAPMASPHARSSWAARSSSPGSRAISTSLPSHWQFDGASLLSESQPS